MFKFIAALFSLLAHPTWAGDLVEIHRFTHRGQEYDLVAIFRERNPFSIPLWAESSSDWVDSIVATLNEWMLKTYLRAGVYSAGDATHKKLLTSDSLLRSGDSTILFITAANNLSKIKILLRQARRSSPERLLPLEQPWATRLPPHPLPIEIVDSVNVIFQVVGDVEAKHLLEDPESRGQFVVPLFWSSIHFGYFYFQPNSGRGLPMVPRRFLARIDRRSERYFRRLGFHAIEQHSDRSKPHELIVEMNAVNWGKIPDKLPGGRALPSRGSFRPFSYRPKRIEPCPGSLGPINFYHEL